METSGLSIGAKFILVSVRIEASPSKATSAGGFHARLRLKPRVNSFAA